MEIWKEIKGYEGRYQVSNLGRVRSLDRVVAGKNNTTRKIEGKVLPKYEDHKGYHTYRLSKDSHTKVYKAHRIIAEAFITKIPNKEIINHIDGDPFNNSIENLEWCTQKENCTHSIKEGLTKSILTEDKVKRIRLLRKEGFSNAILGKIFGVSKSAIQKAITGRNWAWVD